MESVDLFTISSGSSRDLAHLMCGDAGAVDELATRPHSWWNGEHRLLAAVLEQAIHDWDMYPNGHPQKEEVRAWLETGSDWPCHFVALCHELRLAPGWIRRRFQ